ncbi:hypothetical protein [Selenomonas ruminantium]|nr:hypothetical protein [Selenomonas ruminantium]
MTEMQMQQLARKLNNSETAFIFAGGLPCGHCFGGSSQGDGGD